MTVTPPQSPAENETSGASLTSRRGLDEATVISTQTSIGHTLPGRSIGVVPIGGEAMPARQVGRYQIVEKLGEGAMASVYKAFDPSINRPLVIKFLHEDLCQDDEYRMRFLREAKAAGGLSHPNIVTIFDVGEVENRPYIAMELLDGGPLDQIMQKAEAAPLRDTLLIGMQIANALDYAHSKGIFHRDIKPANIIRLADGKTVKLADFGIAHVSAGGVSGHTQVGTVMGTPHYMSPEQARGEKIDARSDLWSVGVMLYQMLTGRQPFNADNLATLMLKITQEPPQPVGELRKDIPPSLRRIIARSMQKQPDRRFQTGKELADALAQVLKEIDPAQTGDRKGRRGLQLKVKLALVMGAVVAVTMGVTSTFVTQRQYQTMLGQTVNQGSSLTKLIAVESANQALSEDWVGIDVFVQEVARALELRGLAIVDIKNVVRVSTDADAIGKPNLAISGEAIPARDPAVSVLRHGDGDSSAFVFTAPIRFQDKEIGKVQLALPEHTLAAVARQSWLLLMLLLIVTAVTVTLATYLLVERYAKPLKLLRESLDEISHGRYDCRIEDERDDELGEVYQSFNAMAVSLDSKSDNAGSQPGGTSENPEKS
jgi:serine/threonine-protein kinase